MVLYVPFFMVGHVSLTRLESGRDSWPDTHDDDLSSGLSMARAMTAPLILVDIGG